MERNLTIYSRSNFGSIKNIRANLWKNKRVILTNKGYYYSFFTIASNWFIIYLTTEGGNMSYDIVAQSLFNFDFKLIIIEPFNQIETINGNLVRLIYVQREIKEFVCLSCVKMISRVEE